MLLSISQSDEISLPSNCHQFCSNKLSKNSTQVTMSLTMEGGFGAEDSIGRTLRPRCCCWSKASVLVAREYIVAARSEWPAGK